MPNSAFIIDADGDIVWYVDGPENPTRALMDYEGDNMWMIALNLDNAGGEMRYVSMDGEQEQQNVAGLETAHHDFTVMPGGKVAALVWRVPGIDPDERPRDSLTGRHGDHALHDREQPVPCRTPFTPTRSTTFRSTTASRSRIAIRTCS